MGKEMERNVVPQMPDTRPDMSGRLNPDRDLAPRRTGSAR